ADLKAQSLGVTAIARAIGRLPSTLSRELKRNAHAGGTYRPVFAEGSCRLRRQRAAVLEEDGALRRFIIDRLAEGWTPEQIAGWLKRGIEVGLQAISHETIYAFIFRAARKVEKLWCRSGYGAFGPLFSCPRRSQPVRRSRWISPIGCR
ncbi:MAG: IS30 family transposase, partial [Rhodobacteraceae bacterium]|nr:IS30 family transposase [Paracoccaceae bacterium]